MATQAQPVLFYSRSAFSNFYLTQEPYVFQLPEIARRPGLPASFHVRSAETCIMLCKAGIMDDRAALARLVAAVDSPRDTKLIGRQVTPFDSERWDAAAPEVARAALLAKFKAHPALRRELLATGSRPIAEASPDDAKWGIGMAADHPDALDPSKWRGQNLLGRALQEVREILRDEEQNMEDCEPAMS